LLASLALNCKCCSNYRFSNAIELWHSRDRYWMQQHQGAKVSLLLLQQALGMPLVEIWLGLLHSSTPYQWEGTGKFYREAQNIWIC